jgi:hypothetical protein
MQQKLTHSLTFLALLMLSTATALAQTTFRQIDEFWIPEANQGVGADDSISMQWTITPSPSTPRMVIS